MKNNQWALYAGLFLILFGIVFLLNLNGILPTGSYLESIQIILGLICLVGFGKNKHIGFLVGSLFFLSNGTMLLIGEYLPGPNFFATPLVVGGCLLTGIGLFMRKQWIFIPGVLFLSWGVYLLLVTAFVFTGLWMMLGMFFVFTAVGFLMSFMYAPSFWAGLLTLASGSLGILIITLGLGEEVRLFALQLLGIGIILFGIVLIFKSLFVKQKKTKMITEDEEEVEE